MARTRRSGWSPEMITDFIWWHENRMAELAYSEKLIAELRKDREKFLPAPSKEETNAR